MTLTVRLGQSCARAATVADARAPSIRASAGRRAFIVRPIMGPYNACFVPCRQDPPGCACAALDADISPADRACARPRESGDPEPQPGEAE